VACFDVVDDDDGRKKKRRGNRTLDALLLVDIINRDRLTEFKITNKDIQIELILSLM